MSLSKPYCYTLIYMSLFSNTLFFWLANTGGGGVYMSMYEHICVCILFLDACVHYARNKIAAKKSVFERLSFQRTISQARKRAFGYGAYALICYRIFRSRKRKNNRAHGKRTLLILNNYNKLSW